MPPPSPSSFPAIDLSACASGDAGWAERVQALQTWAQARAVDLRDAVWLLPFSALLPPARRALAACGGWQPRVETPATLVSQLAPALAQAEGALGGDAVTNRLQAAALLRQQAWGAAWARRDPRAFAQGVALLVRSAQSLQRAVAAVAPQVREAWWADARTRLAPVSGPGETERALARVALEWAAASTTALPSDRLLAHRPSGWIVLRVGGEDAVLELLLREAQAAGVPTLLMGSDPPADRLFTAVAALAPPAEAVCIDAEAEAQASAAQVLAELTAHPAGSVALIAQDRETVRRVRALLERAGVGVIDETGWRLATTRAAARAMALLRAARAMRAGATGTPGAATDARLEWLKDDPLGWSDPVALEALEARARQQRTSEQAAAQAQALWAAAEARLQPLVSERKLPLAMWLERLAALWLNDLTTAADWRDDPAGRSVLMALRLEAPWNAAPAWRAAAGQTAMTLDEFIAWVDEALEEASYVPPADPQARVVITPLARAMLRPFVAAVCPGADDRRLGSVEVQPDLFGPAVAEALGVEGAAHQQRREALAFVQLLRLPRVTLLRREADGVEPVGPSPLVERLRLARAAAQSPELPRHGAQPPQRLLMPMPVSPPLPRVPLATGRWPASLSASAVEALRDCPYRFYSRVLLGLSEPQELDVSPDKRDYGLWLHAVLMRFHEGRAPTADLLADSARLSEAALAIEAEQGLAPGDLLPFRASFEALAPAYLVWLHAREAEGLHWWLGEAERRAEPPEWQGVGLHGRLDRVDHDRAGHVQVLDYKTGSTASLKTRVAEPLEDTQLAFYAALVLAAGDATPDALSAAYLALDDRAGPQTIAHADIAEHAQALLQGLAVDLERLRAGAPLQALGQGPVCDFCEARGLCRRDHWAPPETPLDDAAAEGEA